MVLPQERSQECKVRMQSVDTFALLHPCTLRQFQDFTFGHYFSKREAAEKDFQRRVKEVRETEPPIRRPRKHEDQER